MARKRMIDPEFWLDEDMSTLSAHARLLFIGIWGICDDNYATLPNRSQWIKAQIFPYENVDIRKLIGELVESGRVVLFSHEGKEYLYIKNFFKYQKVEKPSKPKYPQYQPEKEASSGVVGEELGNIPNEVKLREVKRREEKRSTVNGENGALKKLPNINEDKGYIDYLATELVKQLGDEHSEKFYRLVAAKVPEKTIREALSEIKVDGAKNPAKVFTYRMNKYAVSHR